MPQVKFKRISEYAVVPHYATDGAAGLDLYWDGRIRSQRADTGEPVYTEWDWYLFNPTHGCVRLCTGLQVEIPPGFEGQIRPRSSTAGRGQLVHLGTLDSDYRGEVLIQFQVLRNDFHINRGDRIAQLVIAPAPQLQVLEVNTLSETKRGTGGFGSTGR